MSAPSKASIVFLMVSMIQKGLAYITTPIYTNLLTTDEYGKVAVFLTWFQLIGIVAMFSLQAGVFNNGMLEYKDKRDEYMLSMLALSNLITAVSGIVLIVGFKFWNRFMRLDMPLMILMLLLFLTQPAMNFWQSRQRFSYKYKALAIATVSSCIVSPVAAVICILIWPEHRLYARLFGAELALIAFYIFFYVQTIIKAHGKVNVSYWKFAFMFNLPLIPHYLSQYLLSSSDKLMISHLVGDTQTAFYNVAYSVAAVATIVWSAINTSLLPFTYENCKAKKFKRIADVTIPLMLVFAAACMTVIVFAPELIAIMAPPEYGIAIYVVPPVVGGVFFQCMYYIFANPIYYFKKPKYVMYASLIAAIINVILNYIFIPMFGFIAAGYTTIVSYMLQAFIDYLAMRKVMGFSIYNTKLLLGISAAVIAVSLVSALTYRFIFIRYGLFIAMLAVIYVNRRRLTDIFKTIKRREPVKTKG